MAAASACKMCEAKGGLGSFGPAEPGSIHFKTSCPCCEGKKTTTLALLCPKCTGKGGFGPFGPCLVGDVHRKRDCPVCAGKGYTANEFVKCDPCDGKGGKGPFGPCEPSDVHFRSACDAGCGGAGYKPVPPPTPAPAPTPAPGLPAEFLSKRHGCTLTLTHGLYNKYCNGCSSRNISTAYCCKAHHYDLCIRCYEKEAKEAAPATVPAGPVVIRNAHGQNLRCVGEGRLEMHSNSAEWEQWTLEPDSKTGGSAVFIVNVGHGLCLSASNDKKTVTTSKNRSAWESFRIVPVAGSPDKVHFVTAHGTHLSQSDSGVVYQSPNKAAWEQFTLVPAGGPPSHGKPADGPVMSKRHHHPLKFHEKIVGRICDICRKRLPTGYRCVSCSFDLCQTCFVPA